MNEFESKLAKLPKVVFLCGDLFLSDYYASVYIKKLPNDLSVMKLYHHEFDPQTAKNHLSQIGLFGSGNLLIVKTDKKIDQKTLNALIDIVVKGSNSYLAIIYETDDTKEIKSKMIALQNRSDVLSHRFYAPKTYEAVKFLKMKASEFQLNLQESQAEHMLKLHDNNLLLAIGEIGKLAVYNDSTEKMMDQISAGHSEGNILKLIGQIIDKQPFYKEFEHILLENDEPMEILLRVIKNFQQLLMFHISMKLHLPSADFLGYKLPNEVANAMSRAAEKLSISRFLAILEALSKVELTFKQTSTREKKAVLYAALIKLQTTIL
ncbi:MAG: hypothetical protein LBN32_01405 [Helicobacteraceae bacterium]|jgi:DNA polymerase-3 subunit delta|nr:hypothetical protein [Helicobacteraceae bacterium]